MLGVTRQRLVQVARRIAPCTFTRSMANRFPRRTSAPRPSAPSSSTGGALTRVPESSPLSYNDAIASSKIEGTESQIASVNLRGSDAIKVDPSCIISVPLGVEVRPIYGAPQPIPQQQQQPQSSGGLFSRLREAAPPQQQPAANAVILAEVLLQPGQAPQDAVTLGPLTGSKLHTVDMAAFGNEMYISRGSFLAGSSSVNVHNIPNNNNIPGLILQRVEGEGNVVLKIAGQVIERVLGEGEQMFAQANRIVAVESTVQVLGEPNRLLTNLVGPGRVLLQSLPSLESALVNQAEQTQQLMAATGQAPAGGMMGASPFGGPGMGLGSMVMQGMAFGTGSAIAHHAMDSMFGGRSAPAGEAPPAEAPPAAADSYDSAPADSGNSGSDGSFFGSMFGGDEGGDDDGGDFGDD